MTATGLSFFDHGMWTTGQGTRVISTSNTKAGAIYVAPKAGNIRWIGTTYSALSGSPTVDLRCETVSSQLPSGTLFGTNTNAAYSPVATNSLVWTQLTADAVVSAGDKIAVVVGYTSGTSATCIYQSGGPGFSQWLSPYPVVMNSGSWAMSGSTPMVCLKYDDGTIIRGALVASNLANTNTGSGTNPNERATVWTQPIAGSLTGVRFTSNLDSASAYSINLYEGTNTTPALTLSVGAGSVVNASAGIVTHSLGSTNLVAGTTYRLSVKVTSATAQQLYRVLFPSTAERDATFGEMWSDTRNGGAWIGAVTTTSEQIFPLFGSLSAGGGGSPNLNGGITQ